MISRSAPPSVPTESFLLPGFSFCSIDLGALVSTDTVGLKSEFSVDSTGVVEWVDCAELTLAVRTGSASGAAFGGSVVGGLVSTFGVLGHSSSRLNTSEAVVVTEAIVSKEVCLRKRGWSRGLADL